jgi:hypothetical protein
VSPLMRVSAKLPGWVWDQVQTCRRFRASGMLCMTYCTPCATAALVSVTLPTGPLSAASACGITRRHRGGRGHASHPAEVLRKPCKMLKLSR